MTKRLLYIHLFALALAAAIPARAATTDGLTVVELFTSQGCNSCPPADALAGELADRPGVFVLSWNVDYWDFLGWPDTLASAENTQRQRNYNKELGRAGVYTPQMVVGGRTQVIGSDREAVEAAIAEKTMRASGLEIRVDGRYVVIRLPQDDRAQDATVTLVHFDFRKSVAIGGGENHGRTITYAHAVRKTDLVATWDGAATELLVEKSRFCNAGNVILVQKGAGGPILHAAVIGPGAQVEKSSAAR